MSVGADATSTLLRAALAWLLPLPAARCLPPAACCHPAALALPEEGRHAIAEEQEGSRNQPVEGQHQQQAAEGRGG